MADKGWDGWEVLDEPKSKGFTLRDPPVIDTGARYMWGGTYGERLTDMGVRELVPYCGRCGTDLTEEAKDFKSHCSYCFYDCWIGPYQEPRPPKGRQTPGPFVQGLRRLSGRSELSAEAEPFTPTSSPGGRSTSSKHSVAVGPVSPAGDTVQESPRGVSSGEELPTTMGERRSVARGRGRVPSVATKPSTPTKEQPAEEAKEWATDGTTTIWVDRSDNLLVMPP
uniref:Uncharacterized protein n=1 Tax=Xenopus tropicalis TaxID=8364 RepID=A0A1B8XTJ1_XENTR